MEKIKTWWKNLFKKDEPEIEVKTVAFVDGSVPFLGTSQVEILRNLLKLCKGSKLVVEKKKRLANGVWAIQILIPRKRSPRKNHK